MPAPTQGSIETFMTAAFLAQGFTKKTTNSRNELVPVEPPELPDEMKKMVRAMADGLSKQWATWQRDQAIGGVTVGAGGVPGPAALP